MSPPPCLLGTLSQKKFGPQKKKNVISATTRIGRKIQCLPYAGFVVCHLSTVPYNHYLCCILRSWNLLICIWSRTVSPHAIGRQLCIRMQFRHFFIQKICITMYGKLSEKYCNVLLFSNRREKVPKTRTTSRQIFPQLFSISCPSPSNWIFCEWPIFGSASWWSCNHRETVLKCLHISWK